MTDPGWHRQEGFDVRFEWGVAGTAALAGQSAVVVVVDVLRFTTAVEAALAGGLTVHPYRWRDGSAARFAAAVGAVLADGTDPAGPSLSPAGLGRLGAGGSVVLPSPNGSTCAVVAAEGGAAVLASCLRNARAVAGWLNVAARPVTVVACGERWPDGSLRPSVEDLLGAGCLIDRLDGARSPEATLAAAAWRAAQATDQGIAGLLEASGSGRELRAKGFAADLDYAGRVDVSPVVPVLVDGRFVDAAAGPPVSVAQSP